MYTSVCTVGPEKIRGPKLETPGGGCFLDILSLDYAWGHLAAKRRRRFPGRLRLLVREFSSDSLQARFVVSRSSLGKWRAGKQSEGLRRKGE